MGPKSRQLLQSVSDADLSNQAFAFGAADFINIGVATTLALRITYVGELGWELHMPTEQMGAVYDTLWQAGQTLGIANAGHYAINSLRLEKEYLAWGADISPDETPLEAGLGFVVAWDKPDFLGKTALLQQKAVGIKKRMVTFVLTDPRPVLWGSEPILRNGQVVGYTTSGAYGHSVQGAIGCGYVKNPAGVTNEWIKAGHYEIEIAGERVAAAAYLAAAYDPKRTKILG